MEKIKINKLILKSFFGFCIVLLVFCFFVKASSRYYNKTSNGSDLPLAPWEILINNEKVNFANEMNILIEPHIISDSSTGRYQNKLVPGCRGYYEVIINPAGTGVSVDYLIDLRNDNLPPGMSYTSYEIRNYSGSIKSSSANFGDYKFTGEILLKNRDFLKESDTVSYRFYWTYASNSSNVFVPDVDNQEITTVELTLKQRI